jgi:hypothetical protein
LLATNSLLHHLTSPAREIGQLLPLFANDALWLAGHEPSSRFYNNPECFRVYSALLREYRWRKYLDPRKYVRKVKDLLTGNTVEDCAAREAHRRQLFKQCPPGEVVCRLVDFHVPRSPQDFSAGVGLDYEQLQKELAGAWDLLWVEPYSFMGWWYEPKLRPKWRRAAEELRAKYPKDGANFCAVWGRV